MNLKMKRNTTKWVYCLLLAVLFAFCMGSMAFAADDGDVLTRGEARDILLRAADDYNLNVAAEDILCGYPDGRLAEEEPVTKAQLFVMLSRAFGDLPDPKGDSARYAVYPALTDVPGWADATIQAVVNSGIAAEPESMASYATQEDLALLLERIYALFGSNVKDDFYSTVNKEWLDEAVIYPGYLMNCTIVELEYAAKNNLKELILAIASTEQEAGSAEDKIKTVYENALHWDARNEAGIDPIRPYIQAIDDADTLEALLDAQAEIVGETTVSVLLGFDYTIDASDSTRKLLYYAAMDASLSQSYYEDETIMAAYETYLTTLFQLMESTTPNQDAKDCIALEQVLAKAALTPQEAADFTKTYHVYTMDALQELIPGVDFVQLCESKGYPVADPVIVSDQGLLHVNAELLTEENLELLKVYAKKQLGEQLGSYLSRPFLENERAFERIMYGTTEFPSDEDMAIDAVQANLPEYLGQMYIREYFTEDAKADVARMIDEIIAVYIDRIWQQDWMSEETKSKAVEKLHTMTANIGYPDQWDTTLDTVTLRSCEEGGSYLENVLSISKALLKKETAAFYEPMDWSEWMMNVYEVNAYYLPYANSITFPAAILQAPFYDENASDTENLGGIGMIIAHEISHAFDTNGALFDKDGNQNNWWTEEDYAAFQLLCNDVVGHYDGAEIIPGVFCNGVLTVSENVADMGALACITQIESMKETPDYETLYRRFAQCFRRTQNREVTEFYAVTDVHSPSKLRINKCLQSLDEFYEAFDIQPGDGMYLPPEERVKVW